MYIYCIYPAMSKNPKQPPNCLQRAEVIVVLIVFGSVLSEVRTYTVTVSYRRQTWIRYHENDIVVSDRIWQNII